MTDHTAILHRFNQSWHLGHRHRLILVTVPPCLAHVYPDRPMYDELLSLRHQARRAQNWAWTDAMRDFAELAYGETIVDATAESPQGGHDFQYFRRVRLIAWFKKWRPCLAATDPHINLDRLAERGLAPYGPGWLTI